MLFFLSYTFIIVNNYKIFLQTQQISSAQDIYVYIYIFKLIYIFISIRVQFSLITEIILFKFSSLICLTILIISNSYSKLNSKSNDHIVTYILLFYSNNLLILSARNYCCSVNIVSDG